MSGRLSRCRRRVRGVGAAAVVVAVAAGCGEGGPAPFDEPEPTEDGSLRGPPAAAVEVSLRRLTRTQLHHTLHDLLGEALPAELDLRERLPLDDEHGGFASNSTVPPSALTVEQLEQAIDEVVIAVRPRSAQLHPCLGAAAPEAACLVEWIDQLAPRAFRRPLTDDERATLHELVVLAEPPSDAGLDAVDAALERGLRALLLSPDLLYRIERGTPTASPQVLALSDYEIAARLSYLVWSSMPDAELGEQAAAGALRDPVVRAQQLDRMLADPKARRGLADFYVQWLELSALSSLTKDRVAFPTWDDGLRPLLRQQLETFVDLSVRHDDGRLATLLTSTVGFVSPALAPWYGADALLEDAEPAVPAELAIPEGFSAVSLDPRRRAGVLTRLAPLAVHAHAGRTDPVGRGAMIAQRLVCVSLAPPPPDLPMESIEPGPGTSERDVLAQHAADPTCAACHASIDPIGLLLSNYDAMGRWIDEDEFGNPIDARGAVPMIEQGAALDGPVELSELLADSELVHRCHVEQWLTHALGRPLTRQDAALVDPITEAFLASDGSIPALLRAVVTADAFVHRRLP